uniref:Uncharacterized protein n=1 Tax=Ananas comosus var. bracteatus TaxID=296719 RepID=A0A6V7NGP1_ANACO|nr:unnamed protein product [Ananas comosus var. bracteatus]
MAACYKPIAGFAVTARFEIAFACDLLGGPRRQVSSTSPPRVSTYARGRVTPRFDRAFVETAQTCSEPDPSRAPPRPAPTPTRGALRGLPGCRSTHSEVAHLPRRSLRPKPSLIADCAKAAHSLPRRCRGRPTSASPRPSASPTSAPKAALLRDDLYTRLSVARSETAFSSSCSSPPPLTRCSICDHNEPRRRFRLRRLKRSTRRRRTRCRMRRRLVRGDELLADVNSELSTVDMLVDTCQDSFDVFPDVDSSPLANMQTNLSRLVSKIKVRISEISNTKRKDSAQHNKKAWRVAIYGEIISVS